MSVEANDSRSEKYGVRCHGSRHYGYEWLLAFAELTRLEGKWFKASEEFQSAFLRCGILCTQYHGYFNEDFWTPALKTKHPRAWARFEAVKMAAKAVEEAFQRCEELKNAYYMRRMGRDWKDN